MTDDPTPHYQALIGTKNLDYYLSYFRRADARGYAPVSWHWPALFLGFFWFLYRRQFRWALIFMGVSVGLTAVASTLAAQGYGTLAAAGYYTAMIAFQLVYVPLHANAIYYRWAQGEIALARAMQPGQPRQQIQFLEARGGVLKNLPMIVFGILTLMMLLSGPIQQLSQ